MVIQSFGKMFSLSMFKQFWLLVKCLNICVFVRLFVAQSTHVHMKSYVREENAQHLALFCTSFVKRIAPWQTMIAAKISTILGFDKAILVSSRVFQQNLGVLPSSKVAQRFGAYIPWPKMPCSRRTAMAFRSLCRHGIAGWELLGGL